MLCILMKFDHGTVETRRKLEVDPIFAMSKAGKLRREHIAAVESIDGGFRLAVDGYGGVKVHVVEYIGREYHQGDPSIAKITLEREYKRWANSLRGHNIPTGQVLDMIIFRNSPHKVDRVNRQRNGTAAGYLVRALDLYCKMRRWI